MLVLYFRRPSRIEQLRSRTGGYLLEGFAKELSERRYHWVAARKHIRAAEHFLHWIAHRNLSITSVEERCAQQFLDHLKRCCCRGHHPPLKPHRQKYSVDLWFVYLRRAGIVPTPTFVEPAVEAPMLVSFCDWMRRQRGAPMRLCPSMRSNCVRSSRSSAKSRACMTRGPATVRVG
jgi:integrase/recombinase XerD